MSISYSNCRCGAQFETAEHYLLECCLYFVQRQRLENNLNPDFELNFDLLTSGTENCYTEQNKDIILSVLNILKIPKDFNKFSQDGFDNVSNCF